MQTKKQISCLMLLSALLVGFPTMLFGQTNTIKVSQKEKSRKDTWISIVQEQPEGYVVDANGDLHIYTAEAFAWLFSVVNGYNGCEPYNFEGHNVYLENDVVISRGIWCAIGGTEQTAFKGNFNGNGYVVYGLSLDGSYAQSSMGLFGYVSNSRITNLVLRDAYKEGDWPGSLFAYNINLSVVDNCFVDGNMEEIRSGVAPFAYTITDTNVSNCLVHCSLLQKDYSKNGEVHGIFVAYNLGNSYIYNCASIIERMDYTEHCGLIGFNNIGKIENCYAHIEEFIDFGGYAGVTPRAGIAYENNGEIINCYYNTVRNYVGDPYYIETDNAAVYKNNGYVSPAVRHYLEAEEYSNPKQWKLIEPATINGQVTDDLTAILNIGSNVLNDNGLFAYGWSLESDMGFMNSNSLPLFCNWDPTNIDEADNEKFAIFPNPAQSNFTIKGIEGNYSYTLFNAMGQLVKTGTACGEEPINIQGMAQGVYMLKVSTEMGVETQRVVVE